MFTISVDTAGSVLVATSDALVGVAGVEGAWGGGRQTTCCKDQYETSGDEFDDILIRK